MLTPRFDPSCSRQLKGLKTRVLLFSCMDSIYNKESLELNLKIDHTRADYIEVFDSGTLVTEQLPQVGSHPRNLSPTAVNPNVVCLTLTQCTLQLHNPLCRIMTAQVTLGPIEQFVKMLHQRGLCR